MNATALLAAMLAAVHAQHSVHYVSTASLSNGTKIVIVADVAKTEGIQRITFIQGGKTGHVTVLVSNRTAYVRGDAFTLHGFMGIAAKNAETVAGKWVRIPHTEHEYAPVAADVTLPSVALGLAVSGTLTKVKGGIRDTTSAGSLTIYFGADHLPTRELGPSGTMTFSSWNEKVKVAVPTQTLPVTDLRSGPGA